MESIEKCLKHNIEMFKCNEKSCKKNILCKYCEVETKEGLKHLLEHYNNIEIVGLLNQQENKVVKEFEGYELLNKVYLESLERIKNINTEIFEKKKDAEELIILQVTENLNNKYNSITQEFENLINDLTNKVDNIQSSNSVEKTELKKMRIQLEETTDNLESSETIEKLFLNPVNKAINKIKQISIDDLINKKFNFIEKFKGFIGSSLSTELTTGSNKVITVTKSGISYWAETSKEILKGSFLAKIKVINIDSSTANSDWYQSVGIMDATNTDFNSYYSYSSILKSTGEFYNSSGGTQRLFNSPFKTDDTIYMKRDEENNLYFAINDEDDMKLARSNCSGDYKIVFGFMFACNGDTYELEELSEL